MEEIIIENCPSLRRETRELVQGTKRVPQGENNPEKQDTLYKIHKKQKQRLLKVPKQKQCLKYKEKRKSTDFSNGSLKMRR